MSTLGIGRWRMLCMALALVFGLAACERAFVTPAVAQDEKAEAPKAGEAEAAHKAPKSAAWWIIESSGPIGAVILCLSIYFVSTVARLFVEMRPQIAAPPELMDEAEDLLEKRQFKEVYAVVKDDPSFIGKVLSTGIAELPNGLAEARDSMERLGETITADMERKISMLAVLGTLGPMIGLLGTLMGMIKSFSVIALSDQGLNPQEVAGGISEALILTFEGVGLSVPAIFFYAVFRNRVTNISINTLHQADEFLRHFAHSARSKGPAPTAAPAAKIAKAT